MQIFLGSLLARFMTFRKEVIILWRAFFRPETPLYLKVLMVATVLYLFSPVDLIPEFIPVLGFVDDLILVPMIVSWIVSRLPQASGTRTSSAASGRFTKTIDGTARRR
jgi:uncharacterized membrane protein YkvA (DUF1232 family)